MDFKEKVVLISGATGGMGEELARQIAKEGGKLGIFARREEKLQKLSEEIKSSKTDCIYKKCDVKNKQDVKESIELTLKKFEKH